ncbi:CAP_GLY domain-containing protein, partial [Cephalotus follicularis]
MQSPPSEAESFTLGQRVHSANDPRRIGTVKYIGPVEDYSGMWIGVDWDNGQGKHDGSINRVRYFTAKSETSGSFVRAHTLSPGISLLQALYLRYKTESTKEEEDEMYVLSASNKRVSVHLLGKDTIQEKVSRFEEFTGASLSYLG